MFVQVKSFDLPFEYHILTIIWKSYYSGLATFLWSIYGAADYRRHSGNA